MKCGASFLFICYPMHDCRPLISVWVWGGVGVRACESVCVWVGGGGGGVGVGGGMVRACESVCVCVCVCGVCVCVCVTLWICSTTTAYCYDFLVQAVYEVSPVWVLQQVGRQSAVDGSKSISRKWSYVFLRHTFRHIVLIALESE